MKAALADERGRITLGARILEKYGKKFAIVEVAGEVVLVPIAKDPVLELAILGKKGCIDKYTLKELKRMAAEEAESELGM